MSVHPNSINKPHLRTDAGRKLRFTKGILRTMTSRRRLTTALLLLSSLVLWTGCNALKRGDFLQASDDTRYFSEIGFLMSDSGGRLSRDAITEVHGSSNQIYISVPYYDALSSNPLDLSFGTGTPLIINFDVVAKDAFVQYQDTTMTWQDAVSGVTAVPFNDSGATSPVSFRIGKTSIDGSVEYEYFDVYITKDIRPKILNPYLTTAAAPTAALELAFVDEYGTPVPVMGALDPLNTTDIEFDGWRLDIAGSTADVGPPERYILDVRPKFPGEHWINVLDWSFADPAGFPAKGGNLSFRYDPPAVHLSTTGRDFTDPPLNTVPNTGTNPGDPVATWGGAVNSIATNSLFDIYIETGTYDTAGNTDLNPGALGVSYLGIYGGYVPGSGFDSRYTADWDSRPETLLYNSVQAAGTSDTDPSYVLYFDSVPAEFVLDQVQIEAGPNLDYAAALRLDSGSVPVLNDITVIASQGTAGQPNSGMAVLSGSYPQIKESRFFGKNGGTGMTIGIRMDNAGMDMGQSWITGGDSLSNSRGILATDSNLNIWNSAILAGFLDPSVNSFTEIENRAIDLTGGNLQITNCWVHSGPASSGSVAVDSNYSGAAGTTTIIGSSLISDQADKPIGLRVVDSAGTSQTLLINSVLRVAGTNPASGQPATGIKLTNLGYAQISANTIRVGAGDGPLASFGVDLVGTTNAQIHNNLIYSHEASDFLGVRSDSDVSGTPIRYNDFWDTNGPAQLALDPTAVPPLEKNLYEWHLPLGLVKGNITDPVSVDMSFSYGSGDQEIGRITGGASDDVYYGGEDLSGLPFPLNEDKNWDPRTTTSGVGWTMGPYEMGSDSYLPSTIYVATPANGGDDGYPLGTAARPFATLGQAYITAREAPTPRTAVTRIQVGSGSYNLNDGPGLPNIDNGFNLQISGSGSPTLTRGASNSLITFENGGTDTILEGFILDHSTGSGTSNTIHINNNAGPIIRNNTVIGANAGNSSAVRVENGSSPTITNNDIIAGNAGAASSFGVYGLNAGFINLEGNHIQGGIGSVTHGIDIQNSLFSVIGNEIRGGDATVESRGFQLLNNPGGLSEIRNNTILAGSALPAGSHTWGMYIQSAGGDVVAEANDIFGGETGNDTTGVELNNAQNVALINNLIHAGSGATNLTQGITINGGNDQIWLFSNTVYGGITTGNTSEAIHVNGSARPHVINNIIIPGETGGPPAMGYADYATNPPMRFISNLITGLDIPAADIGFWGGGAAQTDVPSLEGYVIGGGGTASGNFMNLAEDPAAYFVNFTAAGVEADFLSDNWRLSGGGSRPARTGGVNLSGESSPYGYSTDRSGAGRSNPWSIGAYE